jgi:exodeoxyribonuclease-1
MAKTFFFYDLETSGLSGRDDRIMQFAGIRTNENLEPIGEPYNIYVKLPYDTLPSPEALLVTGITPQMTQADGLTEAEFAKLLIDEVFVPDTITVGFNNIRFDDEFIRHLLWRNFYDPYEWAWSEGRSRWDILDVVRMTRALRPDGLEWPVDANGKATNRLELLAKANNLNHTKAHDALSDVEALIAVTQLIRNRQPQLFDYLLKLRDKKAVQQLINLDVKAPFVYTSGRYDAAYEKTTVAFPLSSAPNGNVLVYDLRYDPTDFVTLDKKAVEKKIYASWQERQADDFVALPVKILQYNRAPAVAPLGVLEQQDGWKKIKLDTETIQKHVKILLAHPGFSELLRTVFEAKPEFKKSIDPEAQLYDSFVGGCDKVRIEAVRNASLEQLSDFHPEFEDERLPELLLHYKARNFASTLSKEDESAWEAWRAARLQAQLPNFTKSLARLVAARTDESSQFILQELQLWAENILPTADY